MGSPNKKGERVYKGGEPRKREGGGGGGNLTEGRTREKKVCLQNLILPHISHQKNMVYFPSSFFDFRALYKNTTPYKKHCVCFLVFCFKASILAFLYTTFD